MLRRYLSCLIFGQTHAQIPNVTVKMGDAEQIDTLQPIVPGRSQVVGELVQLDLKIVIPRTLPGFPLVTGALRAWCFDVHDAAYEPVTNTLPSFFTKNRWNSI